MLIGLLFENFVVKFSLLAHKFLDSGIFLLYYFFKLFGGTYRQNQFLIYDYALRAISRRTVKYIGLVLQRLVAWKEFLFKVPNFIMKLIILFLKLF